MALGIDVGGTFTDVVVTGPAGVRVAKVASNPHDPGAAVLAGLDAAGVHVPELDAFVHGTTIATNALIERRGARCALITTRGFRDTLELGRRDRPVPYGFPPAHVPLIPRERRFEVDERMDAAGRVVRALDLDELLGAVKEIDHHDVEAVVVCFLHAYRNPAHEQEAARAVRAARPDLTVIASADVARERYEFERTSTAAIHAFVGPLVDRYVTSLTGALAARGFTGDLHLMQSNGGVVPAAAAARRAAHLLRSGPAAGVRAAAEIGRAAGFRNVITADMGGTSFDAAVVTEGEISVTESTLLDFRNPVLVPMIDVHTIGAGGGSIARVEGGLLRVGPVSAGADPGPIVYGRGGTEPTVTDANAVLGRVAVAPTLADSGRAAAGLADSGLVGTMPSSDPLDWARQSFARLGDALGCSGAEAARAVIDVAVQTMANRIRLLTVERGLDPRDFVLVAFGGAGPLHASELLRETDVRAVLVPPSPGVLCALGCAVADVRLDAARTVDLNLDGDGTATGLTAVFDELADELVTELRLLGLTVGGTEQAVAADLMYAGQIHALRVPGERDWSPRTWRAAFEQRYAREYGAGATLTAGLSVSLVTARATLTARRPDGRSDERTTRITAPREARNVRKTPGATRPVFFDSWRDTPVHQRADLRPGSCLDGPAIVEQADTTTVVAPGVCCRADADTNLLLELR